MERCGVVKYEDGNNVLVTYFVTSLRGNPPLSSQSNKHLIFELDLGACEITESLPTLLPVILELGGGLACKYPSYCTIVVVTEVYPIITYNLQGVFYCSALKMTKAKPFRNSDAWNFFDGIYYVI